VKPQGSRFDGALFREPRQTSSYRDRRRRFLALEGHGQTRESELARSVLRSCALCGPSLPAQCAVQFGCECRVCDDAGRDRVMPGPDQLQASITPPTWPPIAPLLASNLSSRQPFLTGRQMPAGQYNSPDTCRFEGAVSTFFRSVSRLVASSRVATGFFSGIFSHSLSSLMRKPARHAILTHLSPSALNPRSQISGQTRLALPHGFPLSNISRQP
jgi:hypothetical protein